MSSITGSRHNCKQGQPKPQLGVGAQPTTTTKPQGGAGGCGSPASYIYIYIYIYIYVCIYGLEVLISMQEFCIASEFDNLDRYLGFTSSLLINV